MVQVEQRWRREGFVDPTLVTLPGRQQVRQERRDRQRLWEQQFWLFGCDIRRGDENLLAGFGCERTRRDDGQRTASSYACELGKGLTLYLWGFGLAVTAPGEAIFVGRSRLVPRCTRPRAVVDAALTPAPNRSRPPVIPVCWRPTRRTEADRATDLMVHAFTWIAAYERWVLAEAGSAWRRTAQSGWRDPVEDPTTLASQWDHLALVWAGSP